VLLVAGLVVPDVGLATNGLNLISSGGISSGLAGADTAVATDFTAMNSNPAGMTQVRGESAGFSLSALQGEFTHRDIQNGNSKDSESDPLLIPNLGYVRHLAGTPITLGIGFFTVGGNAVEFKDLTTALGNRDKRGTMLRHYKLAPTIAYQASEKLSLGASLAVSYADASLTFFPNTVTGFETTGTCNRANGFALPTSCLYALGLTPKFGAMYKVNDMVTLGLAYTMPVNLPLDRGKVARNQIGVGRVNYDAEVFGLKWADDIAAGIAVRPSKDLLIAVKFQWINWDAALNNVVVQLTNGDNAAIPRDTIILNYKWRDQYVGAIGAMYDVTEYLNVRGGYNYGNNPIPKTTLDPTNPNIVEHHIVAGFSFRFTPTLALDATFIYAVQSQRTYDSTQGFGANTLLQVGGYDAGFALRYTN
jgi:long-chain fatty acid transport protein